MADVPAEPTKTAPAAAGPSMDSIKSAAVPAAAVHGDKAQVSSVPKAAPVVESPDAKPSAGIADDAAQGSGGTGDGDPATARSASARGRSGVAEVTGPDSDVAKPAAAVTNNVAKGSGDTKAGAPEPHAAPASTAGVAPVAGPDATQNPGDVTPASAPPTLNDHVNAVTTAPESTAPEAPAPAPVAAGRSFAAKASLTVSIVAIVAAVVLLGYGLSHHKAAPTAAVTTTPTPSAASVTTSDVEGSAASSAADLSNADASLSGADQGLSDQQGNLSE